jgi:hypothetical protein
MLPGALSQAAELLFWPKGREPFESVTSTFVAVRPPWFVTMTLYQTSAVPLSR